MKKVLILAFALLTTNLVVAQGLNEVDPEVLIQKAQSHMESGDMETAQKYLGVVQEQYPNSEYSRKAEQVMSKSGEFAKIAEERKMKAEAAKAYAAKNARSQTPNRTNNSVKEYCLVLGEKSEGSKGMNVSMSYGQSESWLERNQKMINDSKTNKPINFNSMIEALNHHAQFGWTLHETEMIEEGKTTHLRWLLIR